MPTEAEIKTEIMAALPDDNARSVCGPEIDKWASTDNLDGKPILQKFYAQWKSGKKGHQNRANAWVGYYLGMTTKKPIPKFEGKSFLIEGSHFHPKRRAFARPSPPDIDSDFDYRRRQEVLDYIIQRYGRYQVGNIGTWGGLKMKSCLTRIIKTLDIANAFKIDAHGRIDNSEYTSKNVEKVTEIIKSLPRQRGAVLKVNNDQGDEIVLKTIKDVVKAQSRACDDFRFYMDKYPDIMRHANHIEGLLSTFGVHASGVVISDVPLQEIAPLRTAKENGETVALATQWEYNDLEWLGLIKFDVLGLTTLTVIADCVQLIKERTGIELDIENLPIDPNQSAEAFNTYKLYQSGELTGVFQCESDGMQETCMDVGIDRFDDIAVVISLYRPGPMENIPQYCKRKKGEEKIDYFHPSIQQHVEGIIKTTYGVAAYQEDLMRICNKLALMSLGDGYAVIKGVSKKVLEVIEKFKGTFVAGCVQNGVPKEVATQYWEKFIVPFANYGFNKAHALAYAYNSYITAFLKANYPEEYMVACLNMATEERYFEREQPQKGPPGVRELEGECMKMGMTILPRDINKSGLKWEIIRKKDPTNGVFKSELRPPIHCKGLPVLAAENIVASRPYTSPREFAEKTDVVVNKESVEALCDAKFFKTKKAALVAEFETIREDLKNLRKKGRDSDNIFDQI